MRRTLRGLSVVLIVSGLLLLADAGPTLIASSSATHRGDALGRIKIPKIGPSFVVINGTDTASLHKGPGI